MLRQAEVGLLYNPPQNVIDENSDLPIARSYDELRENILSIIGWVENCYLFYITATASIMFG